MEGERCLHAFYGGEGAIEISIMRKHKEPLHPKIPLTRLLDSEMFPVTVVSIKLHKKTSTVPSA